MKIPFIIFILSIFFSVLCMGETTRTKRQGKKRLSVDFENDIIDGQLRKPELLYLYKQNQFNYKKLIKMREHFLPEMRRTAGVVKQQR